MNNNSMAIDVNIPENKKTSTLNSIFLKGLVIWLLATLFYFFDNDKGD